ncbi:MAG: hypothetical protein U0457_06835 [Candidatus Sericytochromatia bacterium]
MEKNKKELKEVPKTLKQQDETIQLVAPEILFKDYDFDPEQYFAPVEELDLPPLDDIIPDTVGTVLQTTQLKSPEELFGKKTPPKKLPPPSKKTDPKKKF